MTLLLLIFMSIHLKLLGAGLSGLADNPLAGVPYSLALVRFGRAEPANDRRYLAHRLLVDPRHRKFRGTVEGDFNPRGSFKLHGVGIAEVQNELFPCIWARYPTPTISRSFLKPVVTPVTMLAMRALIMP